MTAVRLRHCAFHHLPARRHQRGGTAVGFLIGIVVGLAVAAAVAMVVSRSPLPFVNKSDSVNATVITPRNGVLPDPNAGLRPEKSKAGDAPVTQEGGDTPAATSAGGASSAAPAAAANYMLQAGAYRKESDAQAMRARLALIGYEAQVRSAKVNNDTLYRVRVGPFTALDQMNTARSELANNGVEASVVRQ